MKSTHIKVWPELANYQPAIIPFDKTNDLKENSIDLDFTNCLVVDSAGATLLLIDLLKLFKRGNKRRWSIVFPNDLIKSYLSKLGFVKIVDKYSGDYELSLNHHFDDSLFSSTVEPIHIIIGKDEIYSFPIFELDFSSSNDRRDALEVFRKTISNRIKPYFREFNLKTHFLLAIIQELAKNSADHTLENAFFGLDVRTDNARSCLKVQFAYGDLGDGIHKNIKEFISKNDKDYELRVPKMGLSDSYQYALKTGFTTKTNTRNKGMGMTLILETIKALNMNLSVFDANSRALLNKIKSIEDVSHSEIRKIVYDTGRKVGFYYYGELNSKKLENEKYFHL
jgi:hypothetical protein